MASESDPDDWEAPNDTQVASKHALADRGAARHNLKRKVSGVGKVPGARRFLHSWKTKYPWLIYDRLSQSVTCAICSEANRRGLLQSASKADGAFITSGFRSWNKALERFKTHEMCETHRAAGLAVQDADKECPVVLMHVMGKAKDAEMAREALDYIFGGISFLAGQGLPLRRREEATGNLQRFLDEAQRHSPALEKWRKRKQDFTSPAVQNEMLEIAANTIVRDIAAEVRKAGAFSVIVDETQDAQRLYQVSMCLRYVDEELEVQERFVGLYEVPSKTAAVMFTGIKDTLQRLGLDVSNVRGQCYDGASNMAGKYQGRSKIIM